MSATTVEVWGVVGTWVASIGTVAAVIFSLWLTLNQRRVKLNVTAGHRNVITPGMDGMPDICMVHVTNAGSTPAYIVNIGWEVGRSKKDRVRMIQTFGVPAFGQIPKMLQEGETAQFFVPFELEGNDQDWIHTFPRYVTSKDSNAIESLKVVVYASVGKPHKVAVEEGLKSKLRESLEG